MNIQLSKLISKMEEHLDRMKKIDEHSPKLREHAVAVKTLCDLLLDEDDKPVVETKKWVPATPIQTPPNFNVSSAPSRSKLDDDDDANGESIFDF